MKIEKGKKIKLINVILLNCIYIIIGLCFLYNIIFTINTTISQNDYFKLFGITLFNMNSDLMQDDINYGDLVIAKEVDKKELQEGDIIAYTVNGKTRINKIINEKDGYTTKSNKNYYPDIEKVTYNQVIGEVICDIPFLGFAIKILQSKITTAFILVFLLFEFYLDMKKRERARKKEENKKKVK